MPPNSLHGLGLTSADLAPGDGRSEKFDWTGLDVHRIRATDDPYFETAYAALWDEFGDKGEMESRDVVAARFARRPEQPTARGYALQYDLSLVHRGGVAAAVVDHSAIVAVARPDRPAVVHVSHLWIAPPYRRTGLAGWLRAIPLVTARELIARLGTGPRPITLAGEMEPADPADRVRTGRLTAFERAGFRKIDPRQVDYLQPDFRPPAVIDATGGPWPLPLSLVVRRVGRERETSITGGELRAVVEAVYTMYETGFRPQDMRVNWESFARYPADDATIKLVRPTD